jgi:hypothetical protein
MTLSYKFILILVLALVALLPGNCWALEPGTLLFRTSAGGQMYGYNSDVLIEAENGVAGNINSGHVGIYIGQENGEDYVVEALGGGIVKTKAQYFVNQAEGEEFLGAKFPRKATRLQQAKVVALAKSLVTSHLAYDFDFKHQKGPASGQWTCVGLSEKLYESANTANPNNLGTLEYDSAYYAVNITPDGFDNHSIINKSGDCFSRDREFSKIAKKSDLLIPAPELVGYDVGLEYQGERYIFLPYTQFLQPDLISVPVDIPVVSNFSSATVRGAVNTKVLALRWSLINNPISSFKIILGGLEDLANSAWSVSESLIKNLQQKITGSSDTAVVLDDGVKNEETENLAPDQESAKNSTGADKILVKINKATTTANISTNSAKINSQSQSNAQIAVINHQTKTTIAKDSADNTTRVTTGKVRTINTSPTTSIIKVSSSTNQSVKTTKTDSLVNQAVNSTTANEVAIAHSSVPNSSNQNTTSSSPTVSGLAVINRLYNTSNNFWLELYNPGNSDFDLAAAHYRLEKTKSAVDPSLMIRLGNTNDASYPGGTIIKAHSYYLIVSNQAKDFYRRKANAIALRDDFSWVGKGYTIYLGNGAISSNSDNNILEAVGLGAQASYFEGSGPAPEVKDNYILSRVARTNNNNVDYILVPSDDPDLQIASSNSGTTDTASTTNTDISTTTEEAATSSTATSSDSLDDSDDSQGQNSTSSTATTTSQNGNNSNTVDWRKIALISKIYSTGNNDWIELFNASNQDLDLAAENYRLEKTKTAVDPTLMLRFNNGEDALYPGGTVIKANSSYLIVRHDASSYYKNLAQAIALRDDFSWTGSGYTVYLGNAAISSSTDRNIVDLVGFGPDSKYFAGSGPASAIPDNYFLNRLATSGDNSKDFNLLRASGPETATTTDAVDKSFLYIPPVPWQSAGLTDLWHFSECYGPGGWGLGIWDCAKKIGSDQDKFTGSLDQSLSLNNFSLSFYYHKSIGYPRFTLHLYQDDNVQAALTLEPGILAVDNLMGSQGRYFTSLPFDEAWHQISLVINQDNDYWAVYLDGQEKIYTTFLANLSFINKWQADGDAGDILLDEVAIWKRALSPTEVAANYAAKVPFSPMPSRPPQELARLINLWKFKEDAGGVARDEISGVSLNLPGVTWVGRSHNNYAIATAMGGEYSANLPEPLKSPDWSLAFWWRNSSYPKEGVGNVYLVGGANQQDNILALQVNFFRQGFWFNNINGVLSEGFNKAIPNDDLWHHLVLVYDSYRFKLSFYVDGNEQASTSLIYLSPDKEVTGVKISTDEYPAELDDLAIYTGALNPVQITKLYNDSK